MPSARTYQAETLSVIKYALDNDEFDNIVVQAPTGIGKSAIAMTIQDWFQSAYLLTPSLGLTQQYRRDYGSKLKEIKGRSNFPCWVREGTAANAPCWSKRKPCPHTKKDDPCPYYHQKHEAADARLVLSNPAYLFRVIQGDHSFGQRGFAIIDEAHQIEPFLLDFMEVKISLREWHLATGSKDSFPMHYHPEDWIDPIKEIHKEAIAGLASAEADDNERLTDQYRDLVSKTTLVLDLLRRPKQVVIENKNDRSGRSLVIKPIRVNRFAADRLEQISKKRIFLSATILDVETFINNLGLEDQKTLYVNVTKSPFPKENLHIHYAPCGPMSFNKRKHTLPRQIRAITAIMNRYKNKRGVILPHSHAIRREIVEGLEAAGMGDRVITHDGNAQARQVALDHFFESDRDDLVLISTYVGEGFDFKGKLAEWLVICKVPFLPIQDPVINQRMIEDEHLWRSKWEGSPECPYEQPSKYSSGLCGSFSCPAPCKSWYQLQTALKIVQGAGRIVRSPTDVGHLFILDGSWARFSRHNIGLLPSWFRNGIKPVPSWLKRHIQ